MKIALLRKLVLLSLFLAAWPSASAEQHRATRLGNPATRFAPPLRTVEDLRSRFRDHALRRDILEILRQWQWKGRMDDLYNAAATGAVSEVSIPVGSTMPFMSSREGGRPVCLRNVLWAGAEPAPAYAFNLTSNGRLYRCVTPKACSNFFLEDLGPEPVPALALQCVVPEQAFAGRPLDLCLIVRNPGTGPAPSGVVQMRLPSGVVLAEAAPSEPQTVSELRWELAPLVPGQERRFCARVSLAEPALLNVEASARAPGVAPAQTTCSVQVLGIPAILIDAVDLEDPVEVGKEVTYEINVTNQGTSEATNVKLVFTLPPQESFVSGGGATPIANLETEPLPVLAPKSVATWRVVVRAEDGGDVRFKIQLSSDQFQRPIHEEESTFLY